MNVLIQRIHNRLHKQNKNWLAIICGSTGSGKSYSALTLANQIDPSFTVDRVVLTPESFMKILNSGKLKKGNAIIFDEAGVGMPSREWYSFSNKMLSYILQTFRHQNLAVIFTTPSFDFIDSQARKLFHTYIETCGIRYKEKLCVTKWMDIQYNAKIGKTYYKFPRTVEGGEITVINRIKFPLPPQDLINAYEVKKKQYTKTLKQELGDTLQKLKDKANKKKPVSNEVLVKKLKAIMKKKGIDTISTSKVVAYLGISDYKARTIKELTLESLGG